jgi:glycosyltransferase involved in cell wall biosynthesis/cell division protein FtsB
MMSAEIKVSVIIPVYNAGLYLEECLDSVLRQTLRKLEIICVDDGSTDRSLEILRAYAHRDDRLKIIEQGNQGAGAARNAGMAMARGGYLAFMDADDLYRSSALAQAYAQAVDEKADLLAFDAVYFTPESEWRDPQLNRRLLAGRRAASAETDPDFLFQLFSCNTWCKLYRRDFIQQKGLRYQEIKTANDLYFVFAALAYAERIAVLDRPLVKHRVLHSGNLQSVKEQTPLDFVAALKKLGQDLRQNGLWEALGQSYLNAALHHFAYNWATLGQGGRRQIRDRAQEIIALLELERHPPDFYYSGKDYPLACRITGFKGERGPAAMDRLKSLLKRILPPPVYTFHREAAGLKQYMLELSAGQSARQNQQQKQMERLMQQQEELLQNVERLFRQNEEIQAHLKAIEAANK